ncbi:MAG: hypothetical protein HYR85_12310 [Planctomycetes bacterium]|nr:hypothetical protein [Planctomycetota bacterium]MBI3846361.1 hypothetical protein [Planctomycetota bacterium]
MRFDQVTPLILAAGTFPGLVTLVATSPIRRGIGRAAGICLLMMFAVGLAIAVRIPLGCSAWRLPMTALIVLCVLSAAAFVGLAWKFFALWRADRAAQRAGVNSPS